MLKRSGEVATRIRVKLFTWMPGVRPEIMPSRKPNSIETMSRTSEISIDFSRKHFINKKIMFAGVILGL
jgi:Zn-finger domain-containing protein